jgi:hypothetical protein
MHKTVTNIAVLSKLGGFPLHFDIVKTMLSYWYRLDNLGQSFPLLIESKLLHEQNIPFWYTTLNFLINELDGIRNLRGVKESKFKSTLTKTVYSKPILMNGYCKSLCILTRN